MKYIPYLSYPNLSIMDGGHYQLRLEKFCNIDPRPWTRRRPWELSKLSSVKISSKFEIAVAAVGLFRAPPVAGSSHEQERIGTLVHIWYNTSQTVWPNWALYFTLGNFSKPAATIILPKSPRFYGNFCKVVKVFHFSSVISFGQLL